VYLIQLLLPADGAFEDLKKTLTKRFGGFTAFTQSPAEGMWAPEAGHEERDDIIIVEVMTEALDRVWWSRLRAKLESDLKQDLLVIRAQKIETL